MDSIGQRRASSAGRLRQYARGLAATMAVVTLAGCSGGGIVTSVCTTELRSSLAVNVVDATTEAPAAAGATVIVEGSMLQAPFKSVFVRDSLEAEPPVSELTAHVWYEDQTCVGTYGVVVRKSGYSDWARQGIKLRGDACHVTTPQTVVARLVRL